MDRIEALGLKDATDFALQESRMVLPGVQALFGFQLIAVFNPRFEALPSNLHVVHLLSLVLVALTIGVLMAPASLQRFSGLHHITRRFIRQTFWLLLVAMSLLTIALSLDLYVVAEPIVQRGLALVIAGGTALAYVMLWLVFPMVAHHSEDREREPGR